MGPQPVLSAVRHPWRVIGARPTHEDLASQACTVQLSIYGTRTTLSHTGFRATVGSTLFGLSAVASSNTPLLRRGGGGSRAAR